MLQVFSDAGVYEGRAYVSTLILDIAEHHYVTFFCRKYDGVESSVVGELLGVIQSLEWVRENRPDAKEIELNVDSLAVIQKVCDYMKNKVMGREVYPVLYMRLYSLCDEFSQIECYHVPSHQPGYNPNKACDVLCSYLIHTEKAERSNVCMQ